MEYKIKIIEDVEEHKKCKFVLCQSDTSKELFLGHNREDCQIISLWGHIVGISKHQDLQL